jgi:hypothetical protein
MIELFREFFWLIFPILGMGIAFLAVAGEFGRQRKALDVLRVYAEKGVEPPASVLAVLSRASSDKKKNPMAGFAFFTVMALGFAGVAVLCAYVMGDAWPFILGFGIAAFVMVAIAVSNLVSALSSNSSANGG